MSFVTHTAGAVDAGQCCDRCPGDCADACFNEAIERLPGRGVRLLADYCAGCGACLPLCDLQRLTLKQGCVRLA
ncbi:hypothetical protein [uncultured Thiodictyon sp.]|uniref:hypothetical protein n=1 Tax=uncultured Thiodictyon sp. TaxID=1846217 RepID=UPI0025F68852|nr:hypothetical protein [uncultured Thiodictyon sp.]